MQAQANVCNEEAVSPYKESFSVIATLLEKYNVLQHWTEILC